MIEGTNELGVGDSKSKIWGKFGSNFRGGHFAIIDSNSTLRQQH